MIIDGRKIADEIIDELKSQSRPETFFAVFLVGDDAASVSFIKQKEKAAKILGLDFRLYRLPAVIKQDELRKEILKTARHKTCGGVVLQLPLPSGLSAQYALNVIPKEKDVDVLGERTLGAFYAGRNAVLPPACGVVQKIIENCELKIENLKAAVVGLGPLVGKPISLWLERKARDIYLLRRQSDFGILKQADLVIAGAGAPGLVQPKMLKDNAVVIDFGYVLKNGKIMGDFEAPSADSKIIYTPTPGGTGPILVAQLFSNFYTLDRIKEK